MSERDRSIQMFVGNVKDPVAVIERKDRPNYCDDDFYRAYNVWQKWHMGFGLPFPGTWAEAPKRVIDVIEFLDIVNKRIERSRK